MKVWVAQEDAEMPSLEKAFGIHEIAIGLQSQRMEVLASNLANADTPNFKARDIDFKSVLEGYMQGKPAGNSAALTVTHQHHLAGSDAGASAGALYRNPLQPSIDGNTVDTQIEKSKFMENAVHHQATLTFIDGRIKTLRKALRGD